MTPGIFTTQRFVGSGGLSLAADVGGSSAGTPVLFMHGGGQTRHAWHGAMRHLALAGYRVISLDARGHGDSEWSPSGDYALPDLAADLVAVIEQIGVAPALVGASLGGSTGLYALGNSEAPIATALIMVDVVPRVESVGAQRVLDFMRAHSDGFESIEGAIDAVAAYNPHRPRTKSPAGLMKNLRLKSDGRLYWHWDPRIVRSPSRLEPPDIVEPLLYAARRVRVPIALVRGLQSDVVSDAGVAELRGILPGLEVYDVAKAGHMVAGDRNDAFNHAVADFLGRHAPTHR